MLCFAHRLTRFTAVSAAAVLVVACNSDTTGLGDRTEVRFTFQRAVGGASAQAVGSWFASLVGAEGSVPGDSVASLTVTLTGLEYLAPADEEESAGGENGSESAASNGTSAWIYVDIADLTLDLLALPTTAETAIVIGSAELPAGPCRVRLYVSDATIEFSGGVQVGPATFVAGPPGYPVVIPSGDQTGIKALGDCYVPEGGADVSLLFDEGASLANITATGNGWVIVAPVIHVQGNGS